MPLKLSWAQEADVDRIAAIHLTAFNVNVLLHAQFPTPTDRANLQAFLAEQILAELKDPTKAVLVVRDQDEIISFARWTLPEVGVEILHEKTKWPDGSVTALLDEYTEKADAAVEKVMGDQPYCRRFAESTS